MDGALRAIILDFDGVILESNHLKTAAFEAVFARFPEHAEAMMAYHRAHVSDSRFAKFAHLVTTRLGREAQDPLIGELADAFSAHMLASITVCPMVAGAQAFLDQVSSAVPVFLASVTPQVELDAILTRRGLDAYFTRVYGCPPWTKAGAIQNILGGLGGPDGVVFIGDSAGDQRAAHETRVEFLARDSGLPFDEPRPRSFTDMAQIAAALTSRLPSSSKGLP